MNNFAITLKSLRLKMALTQKQMSELLEITTTAYQRYELGMREPKLSVLIKLADFFNITLDELVGRDFSK